MFRVGQSSPATRRAFSAVPAQSETTNMVTAQVPFLDLRVQHEPLMRELLDAFRQVTEASVDFHMMEFGRIGFLSVSQDQCQSGFR